MSAVQDPTTTTTAAPPAEVIVDQVMTEPTPAVQETTPVVSEPIPATTATTTEATKPEETVAAPLATEEKVEEPVVPATEAKIAEPIIEGQLGYKAPGLLKYVLSEDLALKRPPTNVSPGSSLSPRRSSGSTTLLSPLRTWVSTSVARSPRSPTP
jgi:hypothetical protein